MGQIHCRDNRTGIVYVYDSFSDWDETEKKYKARRKLIGRLDEYGNVVPTRGHPGRPRKNPVPSSTSQEEESVLKALETRLQGQIDSLKTANSELSKMLREERRKQQELVSGLEKLIEQFKEE